MNYWLYLDSSVGAVIHASRCPSVRERAGDGWYGPYAKADSAQVAAHVLARLNATHCEACTSLLKGPIVFRTERQ